MEDEKKMSAPHEETQNEGTEIVQQEAELPSENEQQPEENEEPLVVPSSIESRMTKVML